MMNYQDQTSDSIRIFLVDGETNKKQFTILKEETFNWRGFNVTYGILGESHFISFEKDNISFSEICACSDAKFDSSKTTIIKSDFLSELKDLPIVHLWNDFVYTFHFINIEYSRGKRGLNDLQLVKANNGIRSLEHYFPGKTFLHKKAITGVYIKEVEDSLFIRTVHTYPNDKLAVFTNSSLRVLK